MAGFGEICVEELQALLDAAAVRLVDVRTDAEVLRGKIRGAAHIPLHTLPGHVHELDKAATVVVYCHSGVRSGHACRFLAEQGFAQVYNLQGGVLAWLHAGKPLV